MKTEEYNVGDIVYSPHSDKLGYGVITRKDEILWVRWSNYEYSD